MCFCLLFELEPRIWNLLFAQVFLFLFLPLTVASGASGELSHNICLLACGFREEDGSDDEGTRLSALYPLILAEGTQRGLINQGPD